MATTRSALTEEDIRTLVRGATPGERAAAAGKLCNTIQHSPLDDEERDLAAEILRIMAADAAELVRRALAVTLRDSPLVPRDVALRLARDVESVALPILSFSPVFTDEDLSEIVRLGGAARQLAVARRPKLSRGLTEVIADVAVERALAEACANDNADFGERSLLRSIDRFPHSEAVLTAMSYRNLLPLSVSERLVTMVSEKVRDHLVSHHALSPQTAIGIVTGAAERATVDLVDQAGRTADVRAFVVHLNQSKRLTASLLMRALAQGHMTFFEWGVSELSGVPHHRTWLMIHDAGPLGLRAIYERAGLPARLFPAFRAAVDTYHSMSFDGASRDRERFQERMLQRFLTQSTAAAKEDVDYLIDKMEQLARRPKPAPAETA